MKNFLDTLQMLQNTPMPNLLVVAGFILLLLAFVGKIGAIIELPYKRQKWAGIIGTLLLISGIALFLFPKIEPPNTISPNPPSPTSVHPEALIATDQLQPGQELLAVNAPYTFKFQLDGNLIVYNNATSKSLWASNTKDSRADRLVMQNDGNLVLYTKTGSVVWESYTNSSQGDYFLLMQDDGNLVIYQGRIYSGDVSPIWDSKTVQ